MLIAITSIVTLGFSAYSIQHAKWVDQCKQTEPLIYNAVLLDSRTYLEATPFEFEHEGTTYKTGHQDYSPVDRERVYLALGYEPSAGWTSPTSEMLQRIGLDWVLPVSKIGENDVVHCIDSIRWIDENNATAEFGIFDQSNFECLDEIRLYKIGGVWTVSTGCKCW